jgi:hypothetical protein
MERRGGWERAAGGRACRGIRCAERGRAQGRGRRCGESAVGAGRAARRPFPPPPRTNAARAGAQGEGARQGQREWPAPPSRTAAARVEARRRARAALAGAAPPSVRGRRVPQPCSGAGGRSGGRARRSPAAAFAVSAGARRRRARRRGRGAGPCGTCRFCLRFRILWTARQSPYTQRPGPGLARDRPRAARRPSAHAGERVLQCSRFTALSFYATAGTPLWGGGGMPAACARRPRAVRSPAPAPLHPSMQRLQRWGAT